MAVFFLTPLIPGCDSVCVQLRRQDSGGILPLLRSQIAENLFPQLTSDAQNLASEAHKQYES